MSRPGILALLLLVACKRGGVVDNDGDGWFSLSDCNDAVATINPGMLEIPGDYVDNDCDPSTLDEDEDQDGVLPPLDCEPTIASIPAARETPYDGYDNDCDPSTRDDDLDLDGFPIAEDCDDDDPFRSPVQEEVPYDGLDNDCDAGTPDDDLDGDGYDVDDDCDDLDPDFTEPRTYYPDCDGDGFAPRPGYFDPPAAVVACNPPPPDCPTPLIGTWTLIQPVDPLAEGNLTSDCNDRDADAFPGHAMFSQYGMIAGTLLPYDFDCDGRETKDHGQFVCYPVTSTQSCYVTPGYNAQPECGTTMTFASDCSYVSPFVCEMANEELRTVTCQ